MFEFAKTLDLKDALSQNGNQTSGNGSSNGAPILSRLLNQERDGTLIYTWDDLIPNSRRGPAVTHVAVYDPASQAHKILWSNDSKIYITTCSVNADRTLMAYTICDPPPSSPVAQGQQRRAVYRAYLAEISPQKRVFSLNIERSHFLKVQFLYGPAGGVQEKMAHMLLFLHKESIGLYHIPLARVEKGIIMRDQPVTEQMVKKFVWCQWDSHHQRLYYIIGRKSGRSEPGPQAARHVLSCLQFSQNSKYEHMMDLPLNLSFPNVKSNIRSTYLEQPLNQGIPDQAVNTCVLSLSNGTLCVCYQNTAFLPNDEMEDDDMVDIKYTITMPHHARELQGCVSNIPWCVARTARISFTWMNDYLMVFLPGYFVHALDVNIEFEPCHHILLHRKTWEACEKVEHSTETDETNVKSAVSNVVGDPDQTLVKNNLFSLCGDSEETFVKSVDSPSDPEQTEVKTILSDVHRDSDETQVKTVTESVAVSEQSLTFPVVSKDADHVGHLTPFFRKPSGVTAACYMCDCEQGNVYQISVNLDSLVQLFCSCYMASTRQAILHYVIRQGRDLSLLKQLFEMIANDCASPEVPVLMEEFLMGMTYAQLRRQVERDVFRLLPFTTSETFRGVFEKIYSGRLLSRVSYISLQSVNIGTKSVRERQQRRLAEDLWDNLCLHLRSHQLDQPTRFSQDRVHAEYRDMLRALEKGSKPTILARIPEEDSFLGKISARARTSFSLPAHLSPSNRGRSDSVLGTFPPFLSEDTTHPQQDKLIHLTEKLFAAHLGKYLRKDSKIKVANVAKEYISCQMQQAKQLCHMLWSIRGPPNPTEYIPLTEPATDREYELFQLFERFYMAVHEIAYPVPPGFHTYFTVMAFRSLDLSLFLQYVDRGVLVLTGEFVAQIMEDLPDDDVHAQIKLQIISRLPRPLAEECFQKWDHHIAYRHTAMQQVLHLLRDCGDTSQHRPAITQAMSSDSGFYSTSDKDSEQHGGVHSMFHPLDTLLHLMHEREIEQQLEESKYMDTGFIVDVATYNTSEDLSTINF